MGFFFCFLWRYLASIWWVYLANLFHTLIFCVVSNWNRVLMFNSIYGCKHFVVQSFSGYVVSLSFYHLLFQTSEKWLLICSIFLLSSSVFSRFVYFQFKILYVFVCVFFFFSLLLQMICLKTKALIWLERNLGEMKSLIH